MLTGTENTLSASFQAQLSARILAAYGQPLQGPNIVDLLGDALAYSFIPHFVANVSILPGSFANGAGAVTGIGAML